MKIYIGGDHAGYELKEKLKVYLNSLHHEVDDMGAFEMDKDDDYPDFVRPVAQAVADNAGSMGIVLGGSGQGEQMVANKVQGVRATEYYGGNLDIVKVSREHNNANIISLGARFLSEQEAKNAVKIFLETPFSNDPRHVRRIEKM